jgi:hypothetical protein
LQSFPGPPFLAVLSWQSCSCSVLLVPLCLSCSAFPVLPALFCLSRSVCSALLVLFCLSCSAYHVLPVLFWMSRSGCSTLPACSACPVLNVPFYLSCSGCPVSSYPVLPVLFAWSVLGVLFWVSFSGCPLLSVLPRLSYPSSPVMTAFSWQPFSSGSTKTEKAHAHSEKMHILGIPEKYVLTLLRYLYRSPHTENC